MRKTFQLMIEGKNRDRVVDAVKHEIHRYLKRERGRPLASGVDYLDFGCRFGLTSESAEPVHVGSLGKAIDQAAQEGAGSCYVEILAKPGHRKARPPADDAQPSGAGGEKM